MHGGPLDVGAMQDHPRVRAILAVGHPGHGSQGIADVLVGKVAPAGRLPVTWHFDNYTQLVMYQGGAILPMWRHTVKPTG